MLSLYFIINLSGSGQQVNNRWYLYKCMRWRDVLTQILILSLSISLFSRTAWEGLKKPVKTFSSDHILKCSGLCTGIPGDCDTFHYDFWHQLCSLANIAGCISSDHQLRDKRESEGDNPCTAQGEIGVWLYKEVKYCEEKQFGNYFIFF